MNTRHKLLDVRNLTVSFTARKTIVQAVRDISFELYAGETLGIVGESGCGKSVTAKAILHLIPHHCTRIEGHVLYKGRDLARLSEREMQKVRGKEIGMIFQDPMTSLNPTLKIGYQIIEGYLRHHPQASRKQAKQYAIDMLELVGIPQAAQRADEYPHTLSGGMRQRAMIALALASNPALLIADEPTTALDVTIQAQILDLLKNIQKKTNTSIILITHDLSVVAGFCDRVLVMYAGKILESASVEELFSAPRHPYTERLLQSIPRLSLNPDHPLLPIEGAPPNLMHPPAGCGFCNRCAHALNICATHAPPLVEVAPTHHSACWLHDARANK